MKNLVKRISPDSPLRGIVESGDRLLSINGKLVRDVLDYLYYGNDETLQLAFLRKDGRLRLIHLRRTTERELGLEFETYLMDAPRRCANNCVFCFIDQNPPGMRQSIYFKDDDARLSFLMGCYLTLTNLSQREIRRICDLRISPINISVHTTDPELRRRMLGNPRAGEILSVMKRFAAAGITMNCQIVCCPDWNDGEHLLRTLNDLRELYPAVNSISIVPVGLTAHRTGLPELRPFTQMDARKLIALVEAFQRETWERYGTRLAFCSDEFYLCADLPIPSDKDYESYPQLENGVGMLRLTETEFRAALSAIPTADGIPFAIAAGTAAAPLMEKLLGLARAVIPELNGRVYAVRNDFYGEQVTVSGLLTGGDLVKQLQGQNLGQRLLISQNMLRRDEADFLDGMTLAQASETLGVPIYPVSGDGGALLDAICGRLPEIPTPKGLPEPPYNPYHQSF